MNVLSCDESGELVSGFFYELYIAGDIQIAKWGESDTENWLCSSHDPDVIPLFGDLRPSYKLKHGCPLNPKHETDREIESCSCRLYYGEFYSDKKRCQVRMALNRRKVAY